MATITPQQLKQKLGSRERIVLLDVREPFEYDGWHIPGAVNIPMSHFMRGTPELTRESEIIAICAHGQRSAAVTGILSRNGYRAFNMEGGMVEWNGVYDFQEVIKNIIQVKRIGKGCLSYILMSGSEAVVIDPTIDIDIYIDAATKSNKKIVAVLDTHAHADHASGGRMIAQKLNIKYYAPDEVEKAKHERIKDGDIVNFGSSQLSALAAPGHTPGSLVYKLENFIFTGDTLFVDGVGRPDLGQKAPESAPVLYGTLQKLLSLPDSTIVLPAHYEVHSLDNELIKTTIGYLKNNLGFTRMSKEEFISWVAHNTNPAPPNFETIKSYNTGKMNVEYMDEFRELEAGANRCGVKQT